MTVIISENILHGGLADHLNLAQIAKKHKVSPSFLAVQLTKGIEVESEHTNDKKMAKEIAMDHLSEIPDYYDRLEKMEKEIPNEFTHIGNKLTKKVSLQHLLCYN